MSLRIRRSLIWETRKPSFSTSNDSPVFILMDSKWRLELSYFVLSNRKNPIYQVSLRNCSLVQSFLPFEVKIFFEDKRNNVQIHLSTLNVSSRHEILCRMSLNSICKKLPGIEIYDDITVVCVFNPWATLHLHQKRKNGSSLKVRESLVWETKKPSTSECESPVFVLNNSNWKLGIKKDISYDVPLYQISIKECSKKQSFLSFDVTTLIEDRRNYVQMRCSKITVASASETLCRTTRESIYKKLPELKHSDDITIICIFSAFLELDMCVKKKRDMEETAEGFQSRKRSRFCRHGSSVGTSSLSKASRIPHDLKSLSEDLCLLLDKKIMADTLLKSGDEVIPVHKLILAARSEVFSAMLQHEMSDGKNGIVAIKDIEPVVLRPFLKYIYSGKIPDNLSEETIYELYSVSDKYAVPSLGKLCSTCMISCLNRDNFTRVLVIADAHGDEELKKAVAEYVTRRPYLITKDIWKRFSENCPKLSNEVYQKLVAEKLTK